MEKVCLDVHKSWWPIHHHLLLCYHPMQRKKDGDEPQAPPLRQFGHTAASPHEMYYSPPKSTKLDAATKPEPPICHLVIIWSCFNGCHNSRALLVEILIMVASLVLVNCITQWKVLWGTTKQQQQQQNNVFFPPHLTTEHTECFFRVEYPPEEDESDFVTALFILPTLEELFQKPSFSLVKVEVTCRSCLGHIQSHDSHMMWSHDEFTQSWQFVTRQSHNSHASSSHGQSHTWSPVS